MQLEKYNHPEEERQEYTTWENGWKVFGWSIKRTGEVEQGMLSAPVVTEPMVEETAFWPVVEPKEEELPLRVMQHLEQFYFNHVATLQKVRKLCIAVHWNCCTSICLCVLVNRLTGRCWMRKSCAIF
ncbi:hypothetical protein GIJ05_12305 [Laceyella tengchongensis]|nr:hypothetical protein [Laceyella tengchongensis]